MEISQLTNIYGRAEPEKQPYLSKPRYYNQHTMLDALYLYVSQKFPVLEIYDALDENYDFEIHGIYPEHSEQALEYLGYKNISKVNFDPNPRKKRYNYIRPAFFKARKNSRQKFIITVIPGQDYIYHYMEMLEYLKNSYLDSSPFEINTIRYPTAENTICSWSNLNRNIVNDGDFVILGYVDELMERLSHHLDFVPISNYENDYYGSSRFKCSSGMIINFVGVKFSFWGNISAKIAEQVCSLGAQGLWYVSKVGTLLSPEDVYSTIFFAGEFILVQKSQTVYKSSKIANDLLKSHSTKSSTIHASVPTVLEEDFKQRQHLKQAGASTVDNELSQIAKIVEAWNELSHDAFVTFGSMNFATDFLHGEGNVTNTGLNLSNNRSSLAKNKKSACLDVIAKYAANYFSSYERF